MRRISKAGKSEIQIVSGRMKAALIATAWNGTGAGTVGVMSENYYAEAGQLGKSI